MIGDVKKLKKIFFKKSILGVRGSWVILSPHHMAFKLNLLKWLAIASFLPESCEITLHGHRLICKYLDSLGHQP